MHIIVIEKKDVFEEFRNTCILYYGLDPCHYSTSSGLSWDGMLKMADMKLDLISDIDIYQFIEKGIGGGVRCVAQRYGKDSNKYMKTYDKDKPSKCIVYEHANSLYE